MIICLELNITKLSKLQKARQHVMSKEVFMKSVMSIEWSKHRRVMTTEEPFNPDGKWQMCNEVSEKESQV